MLHRNTRRPTKILTAEKGPQYVQVTIHETRLRKSKEHECEITLRT